MPATFSWIPDYPYKAKLAVEKTNINELDDGSEIRLEQGPNIGGTYSESYTMSGAEFASLMAFFEAYRLAWSFTKRSYNPAAIGFDADDPASLSGPEETVRFFREPSWSNPSVDVYKVTLTFKRLPNE